jgi:hypothetical protein
MTHDRMHIVKIEYVYYCYSVSGLVMLLAFSGVLFLSFVRRVAIFVVSCSGSVRGYGVVLPPRVCFLQCSEY